MSTGPRSAPTSFASDADAGWELGVRRLLPSSATETWRVLLAEWLPQWLEVESVPQMVGAPLRADGRIRGRVVGCHVGRRLRVRWTSDALDHETLFQVTLQQVTAGARPRTVIEIHQEQLPGIAERQRMLEHWTAVLEELGAGAVRE